ncbi:Monoacylglycerol lipase ABHD12 [Portunus trituberculatus]|uniref:Monoacylglycerol lipase ABHD12 n=1 Tax=Portunus trituberculatus TaxID=210409 RepID=A0A5B7G2K2_PORTR|nr:Monoacylglycerol lipase ABHD12 [Portunus trituberculatus]
MESSCECVRDDMALQPSIEALRISGLTLVWAKWHAKVGTVGMTVLPLPHSPENNLLCAHAQSSQTSCQWNCDGVLQFHSAYKRAATAVIPTLGLSSGTVCAPTSSYGDSSPVAPSEEGLVADTKAVFRYLRDKSGNSPLFVWGHSLGTGVSCHALSELCQANECPQGLVLEAPFNNLHDEIRLNPLSQVFHSLPYFDWAFIDPIRDSGNEFKSDSHIMYIPCPVLILHAQDDVVVPIELGRRLYKAAKDSRLPDAMPVTFVELEAEYGFGHLDIPHAPNFLSIIR